MLSFQSPSKQDISFFIRCTNAVIFRKWIIEYFAFYTQVVIKFCFVRICQNPNAIQRWITFFYIFHQSISSCSSFFKVWTVCTVLPSYSFCWYIFLDFAQKQTIFNARTNNNIKIFFIEIFYVLFFFLWCDSIV